MKNQDSSFKRYFKAYSLLVIFLLSLNIIVTPMPASAKWWKFHIFKKSSPDSATETPSSLTTAPTPAALPTSSLGTPAQSSQLSTDTTIPLPSSLSPPPLLPRPPIPEPAPVACPAPLGSGIPKPSLAWRAKALSSFEASSTTSNTSFSTDTKIAVGKNTLAPNKHLLPSKIFSSNYDATYIATISACRKAGLTIQSMDSCSGKVEATASSSAPLNIVIQVSEESSGNTRVTCSSSNNSVSDLLFSTIASYLQP